MRWDGDAGGIVAGGNEGRQTNIVDEWHDESRYMMGPVIRGELRAGVPRESRTLPESINITIKLVYIM